MKSESQASGDFWVCVAPLAGAWVEIWTVHRLKITAEWSLPSRERGLKLNKRKLDFPVFYVAPLAGAWVEIPSKVFEELGGYTSLPSRERGLKLDIEITARATELVAPLAGAWVEILGSRP